MRILKTILFLIYLILIILLLLLGIKCCRGCSSNVPEPEPTPLQPDPIPQPEPTPQQPEPEQVDSIIEQAQETGNSGDLKITLLWDFQGDIDLHVKQPNGKTIYFRDKNDTSTGGSLDVDNTRGGTGSAENIYWENPPQGTYSVSLVYFQASTNTKIAESGTCTVVVFKAGSEPQKYELVMSRIQESKVVTNINI